MQLQKPLARFRFGEFELDAVAFRVLRDGSEVPLEPKAVDLLLYLVQRPGELVAKEELFDSVWGGTAVTDNALTRVVAQLRRALGDEPHHPRFIETVPTRGYRFIASTVREAASTQASSRLGASAPTTLRLDSADERPFPTALGQSAGLVVAGLAFFVVLAWSVGPLRRSSATYESEHPLVNSTAPRIQSLAVLSLKNVTGDARQEYFVEGMSQALRDTFAKSGMTIAAATSSRVYAHSTLSTKQICQELHVDALLEGAVFKSSEQIRVSVALIYGSSERRLWSATYERPLADVLNLYSDIALTAASEMNVAVADTDRARIGRQNRVVPEAYDNYLKGAYFAGNRWMAGGCGQAEPYLLDAIAADPAFAPSYAVLAWCYAYPDRIGRSVDEVGPKARAAVAKALALDDQLAMAHVVQGTIKWRIDYEPAVAEIEFKRALALDAQAGLAYMPCTRSS